MNNWFKIGSKEAILLKQSRPPNSIAKIPYLLGYQFSKKPKWAEPTLYHQRWHDLYILKHKDRLFKNSRPDTRRLLNKWRITIDG